MTGKVVNLRTARKARARSAREARAEANAIRHGVPKAEKTRLATEAARAERDHEGHKRE